ncbi:MAG: protein kinase/transcriptional regulator, LuxR family protein [Nocardia sp.]|uniref:protein kinase domain-containing protein n=1 Tax=Nocardia sp. TaxID=1821 RepID=UPI002629E987|nr:protein kinase [Nocardia sp.]MCU1645780.1 protein kinase/transcriptional regulator, LuxR family protein [Nocardia sp.]
MNDPEPSETQRDLVASPLVAELEAAGFEDVEEIGRGGFGVVYRCRQPALDRTVAVKVLTADLEAENRDRFLREQRAMGRLTGHPNVVNALEVGSTSGGRPFIVMQYCAQGSLDARIRRTGALPLEDLLHLGIHLAGALETLHRLGVLHRDIKPANILRTDYGEPALTDFGIAHFSGGFQTETGVVTGSPAFTAPEVLTGGTPSAASDIYSLGATLFCALTGHAAFERHSGEQVVAQFVRITTEPVPDLRGAGIPDDVSAVIERAMSAHPEDRQRSAAALGDELRDIQGRNGFRVDEMALRIEDDAPRSDAGPITRAVRQGGAIRNLPLELTSLVGRDREVASAKHLLSTARLVTLAGIGGVGKTRLAVRLATAAEGDFADGLWFVELGELVDEALVSGVVVAALGLREAVQSPEDTLLDFLGSRRGLLILDNCEQVIDGAAKLCETLLKGCARLQILVTSREPLGIDGEAVLRVPPLTIPESGREPSRQAAARYAAVTLFAERARAAVPTFELTEDNWTVVVQICRRLDGVPLAIELAAARLRAMSPEQLLGRLADSLGVLTRGARGSSTRQQALRRCIEWSYQLCTSQEQLMWSRLSVFAGGIDLDAAEQVCDVAMASDDVLDILTALVDKSILLCEPEGSTVRYRMLEILRDYGREQAQHNGEYLELRRRHRDWFLRLALQAQDEWVGARQLDWIARLEREQSNLRDAMEFCVSDDPVPGLRIASALYLFWSSRGLYGEGRHWFDRLLNGDRGHPRAEHVMALYADSALADMQGDFEVAAGLVQEGQALAAVLTDPAVDVIATYAEGFHAYSSGQIPRARTLLTEVVPEFGRQHRIAPLVEALIILGLCHAMSGSTEQASDCYVQVLEITESRGESVGRSYAQWALGVLKWQTGESDRATALLEEALTRLAQLVDDPVGTAMCLEALAWIACDTDPERAAVLMGAAAARGAAASGWPISSPNLLTSHAECVRSAKSALGAAGFAAASQTGEAMPAAAAVAYALGK